MPAGGQANLGNNHRVQIKPNVRMGASLMDKDIEVVKRLLIIV